MSLKEDAIFALRALLNAPHAYLEDHVYQIREREGEGWEGPAVKYWSNAIVAAKDVIRRADTSSPAQSEKT